MKTTYVSSMTISSGLRHSVQKLQADVGDATNEATNGRYTDVGLQLGESSGYSVKLQQDNSYLESIIDTNALVKTRMEASQAALDDIRKSAVSFRSDLIAAQKVETGPATAEASAINSLKSMAAQLNTNVGGQYLFAGVNTDVQPANDYTASPAPQSATAVKAAFTSFFGFPPGDAQAINISKTQMQSFIDGPFAKLFDDPDWGNNWSSASNQNIRSRIAPDELVETSVNANDTAMRKLSMAYSMVASLGNSSLSHDTFSGLLDSAISVASQGIDGVIRLQSKLGTAQSRVDTANTNMKAQADILTKQVNAMEGVDPYEAAERVKTLSTQLDTAYALTSRIHQLSLLKYL